MEVRLRSPGIKLPRGHAPDLVRRVREAFARVAHRISRVDVSLTPASHPGLRDCIVEVHMTDGHVELVRERQRHLGAALQRALKRAWYRTTEWVRNRLQQRERLRLAASRARAEPAPLPTARNA